MTSLSASKPTKEVFMTITQKCSFELCNNNTKTRGLCKGHYEQFRAKKPLRMLQTNELYENRRDQSEYKIWVNMRYRCNNVDGAHYKDYGGRGIKVCDRWNDYDLFMEDMGKRPSPSHSIERIDVNGDYEPSNCKWATYIEQNRNTRMRSTNTSGVKGIFWDKRLKAWQAKIKINGKRIHLKSTPDKNIAIAERLRAEYKYWGVVSSASEYLITKENKEFIYGTS